MKKILIAIVCLMLCITTAYALVVDSEDFETYTNWADGGNNTGFLTESNGVWGCGGTTFSPECYRYGSDGPPPAGFHGFNIANDGLNNYLSVYAYTPYCSAFVKQYYYTWLAWNISNSTQPSLLAGTPMNYIINMSMKANLISDPANSPINCGLGNWYGFTAGYYGDRPINGTSQYNGMTVGGVVPANTSDMETFSRLRPIWLGFAAPGNKPAISNCDINDGNWHQVWTIYRVNGTNWMRNYTMYVDGVACFYYDFALNLAGSPFFSPSQPNFPAIRAYALWSTSYDNITLCQGNATLGEESCFGTSYNCSDGIDNDLDGYIDYPADPSCSSAIDTTESPNDAAECNDGIDNDLDGFIDFGIDPECSEEIDLTESPYHYTACNNGIDDDADGAIDLLDSCCPFKTNTSESCALDNTSIQPNPTCLVQNRCILADNFPYTDNITLHNWYGNTDGLKITNIIGSNQLQLKSNISSFTASLDKRNPNIYSSVIAEWEMVISPFGSVALPPESFYLVFKDSADTELIKLRFDLTNTGLTPFMNITWSNYDAGNATPLINFHVCSESEVCDLVPHDCTFLFWTIKCGGGRTIYGYPEFVKLKYLLTVDQTLKTYRMEFWDRTDDYVLDFDIPFSDVMASKIEKVEIQNINLTKEHWYVYFDNMDVIGDLSAVGNSTCTDFASPYYLKEEFNGYPSDCGWTTYDNSVFFLGQFLIDRTTPRYYIQKQFSDITETATRYSVIQWNMNVMNITGAGNFVLRLYDADTFNFFSAYMLDNSNNLFYNQFGTSEIAYSVPLNQWIPYKVIIDNQGDTFDIYANGTKVVSDGGFTQQFYNLHEYNMIKYDTSYFDIAIDNVAIYASDSTGNSLLPEEVVNPTAQNETIWCGLIYRTSATCSIDADCPSADCLPNHKCNTFNMKYCDEHGMIRGNKCYISSLSTCALENTTSIVLDNFLWVIVVMLILMAIVYLNILLRRRG